MSLIVSLTITRTILSLSALELNDGLNYLVSDPFDPGPVVWMRQQVQSPFVDGKVTVGRIKDAIPMKIGIDILGANTGDAYTKAQTLIDAFTQDTYTLTLTLDSAAPIQWAAECADYEPNWDKSRIHNHRYQLIFTTIRQPNPLAGVEL